MNVALLEHEYYYDDDPYDYDDMYDVYDFDDMYDYTGQPGVINGISGNLDDNWLRASEMYRIY